MKKLTLTSSLLLVLISCFSQAQKPGNKFSVLLEGGLSVPLGRFAHTSFSSSPHDTSGNAIRGFAADVTLRYQLKKSFGISLLVGGAINRQDEQYLKNDIQKTATDEMVVEANTGTWKLWTVMPGVFYTIPFSPGSKFELKPMLSVGICKSNHPGYSYGYYYPDMSRPPNHVSVTYSSLPLAFCYRVSLGLDYAISNKIFVLLDANYFGASPVLKYNYYPNWPQITNFSEGKKKYSLASLNLMIGAGIRF